jgi:hypothetical protein
VKRLFALALLITLALAVAGCGTEAYDKRAKSAHVPTIKRASCHPAYEIQPLDVDAGHNIKVCTFTNPAGESCTQYFYSYDAFDVDCTPREDITRDEAFE